MNNVQKLKLNSIMSLLNRVVIMISGLILPRLILVHYGSEINGLVSSITQFLSIITFLDLGVGSVVQSALYKPLAKKDIKRTSEILVAAKNYFRRIAYILIVYVILLILFYPSLINDDSLNPISTALLIVAISISQFAQYYFGIINEFLLNADQKSYIQLGTEIIVAVLNLLVSAMLITQGALITVVKLATSLIYLIRPIMLSYYVKKNYQLNLDIELTDDPLPQKWSGMGQHIAYSIQNSTDVIVLTIFSTLSNVSIYSVYNSVANAIKIIISSFTTGLQPFFGNLLANDQIDELNDYFSKLEWVIHTLSTFLYAMTAVLISAFVLIYTSGVDDVDYYQPVFAIVLVLARFSYTIRTPYQALVFSAGHFKQTQLSSYIEAGLNIILSVLFVSYLGLVGVAIGSLIAMLYRTIYLAWYLERNIVKRSIKYFIKHIIIDAISFSAILWVGSLVLNYMSISNFFDWIIVAIIVGVISAIIVLVINILFYKDMVIMVFRQFIKKS